MSIDNQGKNLPDSRFFISENLTPMNSKTALIELRTAGFLQNTYPVNGVVHMSGVRVRKKVMKIFYESMLHEIFSEYDVSRCSGRLEKFI